MFFRISRIRMSIHTSGRKYSPTRMRVFQPGSGQPEEHCSGIGTLDGSGSGVWKNILNKLFGLKLFLFQFVYSTKQRTSWNLLRFHSNQRLKFHRRPDPFRSDFRSGLGVETRVRTGFGSTPCTFGRGLGARVDNFITIQIRSCATKESKPTSSRIILNISIFTKCARNYIQIPFQFALFSQSSGINAIVYPFCIVPSSYFIAAKWLKRWWVFN